MYRIRGGYLLRQIVGEWVVIAVGGDASGRRAFMALNETGALIWQMLEPGADEADLAKALADAYGIDPARAAVDARAFVRLLMESGIAEAV